MSPKGIEKGLYKKPMQEARLYANVQPGKII